MKRPFSFLFCLGVLLCSAGLSCAGRIVDDADPACETTLGAKVVQHTCAHTENGPFAEVAAGATEAELPDVSQLHRPFDVTTLSLPFSMAYRASREGTHVLFTDKPATWEVFSADGAALDAQTEVGAPSREAGGCAGTTHATLVELQRGHLYTLSALSASRRFVLFVEHADTFGDDALVIECLGDGT